MKYPARKLFVVGMGVFGAALLPAQSVSDADVAKLMKRLESLEGEVSSLRAEVQTLRQHQSPPPPPPLPSAAHSSLGIAGASWPALAAHSLPEGVSADELKGFIPVFENEAWLKIGFVAQVDAMIDSSNVNSPGMFVTSAIATRGSAGRESGYRSELSMRQSSLSAEGVYYSAQGPVRVHYANNFFGEGNFDYNLKYFYADWQGLLAGYNYSAFTDDSVIPNTLDWEGPNSLPVNYNAQIRYVYSLHNDKGEAGPFSVFGSVENPGADVTGTASGGRSRTPDFVVGTRYERESWHVQGAALVRSIYADDANGDRQDELGWGLALSAAVPVLENDSIGIWGQYGQGIATYIQDAYGYGLDAIARTGGGLDLPAVYGIGISYTRQWNGQWSSTATYGYVHIETDKYAAELGANPDLADVLKATHYVSANLIWQVTPFLAGGVEYLYGHKENWSGNTGDDHRIQFTVKYLFNQ